MVQAAQIQLIVFDVDGVLTDGSIFLTDDGIEFKRYNVRDGFAMRAAGKLGLKVGVITGRSTRAVTARMADLEIPYVLLGQLDKKTALQKVCDWANVKPEWTAFVGDDLIDLPAMLMCGYPISVADAVPEVKHAARYVTQAKGGYGAGREAIEHILNTQGKWAEMVSKYLASTPPPIGH